jgi:hypothetical protein
MLGKPWAVLYSFLWSIAYGMIVSIILTLVLFMIIPKKKVTDVSDLGNVAMIIAFASLAAAITQIWLVFGNAYQYGLVDCPEASKLVIK